MIKKGQTQNRNNQYTQKLNLFEQTLTQIQSENSNLLTFFQSSKENGILRDIICVQPPKKDNNLNNCSSLTRKILNSKIDCIHLLVKELRNIIGGDKDNAGELWYPQNQRASSISNKTPQYANLILPIISLKEQIFQLQDTLDNTNSYLQLFNKKLSIFEITQHQKIQNLEYNEKSIQKYVFEKQHQNSGISLISSLLEVKRVMTPHLKTIPAILGRLRQSIADFALKSFLEKNGKKPKSAKYWSNYGFNLTKYGPKSDKLDKSCQTKCFEVPMRVGSRSVSCVVSLSEGSLSPIFAGDNSGTFLAVQDVGRYFVASTGGKHARFEEDVIYDTNISNGGKHINSNYHYYQNILSLLILL